MRGPGGRLVTAPPAGDDQRDGVSLVYRPLREIGEDRPVTNTNRDYLGVLWSIGSDQATVDRVAAEFLADQCWKIHE